MSTYGFLDVLALRDGVLRDDLGSVLRALENHGVTYELHPQGLMLEAPDAETLFEAAKEAHTSLGDDRVITQFRVDETHPERVQRMQEYIDMA